MSVIKVEIPEEAFPVKLYADQREVVEKALKKAGHVFDGAEGISTEERRTHAFLHIMSRFIEEDKP